MSAADFQFRRWMTAKARAAAGMSSPPSTGGEVARAKPETERGSTGVDAICGTPPSGGSSMGRLRDGRILATDTPLSVRAAPDFSAFTPLDFAPPDAAGAVVGDPASDVVTIHVRRPKAIAGASDIWLTFQTDDAADLAARIADVAGGDRRRAGLIAAGMTAWAGAIAGSLLTILAFGVLQP